ncbi:hypothetical protein [Hydrogenophaga sp.]|uniref:hypothetical protein n=1 Tax=Hydrogenophaga sp. TaxID=1904254 RepID=UPI002727584E|nr:hypothetical protein [Hydrogenophaga sp.]MDO9434854.1 hypothetical protein [Hydrogenophaga sp.]
MRATTGSGIYSQYINNYSNPANNPVSLAFKSLKGQSFNIEFAGNTSIPQVISALREKLDVPSSKEVKIIMAGRLVIPAEAEADTQGNGVIVKDVAQLLEINSRPNFGAAEFRVVVL